MEAPITHLCYGGTSGSSRVAIDIAAGSQEPKRHAYVLYGVGPMREDYGRQLDELGCAWRFIGKKPGLDLGAYSRTAGALLAMNGRAIVLHGSRSLPVALCLRRGSPAPVVAVQHGPASEFADLGGRLRCGAFSELADATVTVSNDMAQLIEQSPLLRRCCKPIQVIPNGVDVAFWRREPRLIDPAGPVRLAMVATLSPYKDHATLLRALKLLRDQGIDARLTLIGEGVLRGALAAQVRELGIGQAAEFVGDLTRQAVRQHLAQTDILVHITHSESFGMAVLEGMCAGLPVVASDVPGVRELVTHGHTGLLAPRADAGAVAARIQSLVQEPASALELARKGQQRAQADYSAAAMAQGYEQLVQRLANV